MDELVNECGGRMDGVGEWIGGEWMGWVNGCVGECTQVRLDGWVIGCMIGWISVLVVSW